MLSPAVGNWYRDIETGALFEVVALDDAARTVETQFLDGEVTEYDLEVWRMLQLQKAAAPEDWRTPFELDDEDSQDPDQPYHPEEWSSPVSTIEPDTMLGVEDS
ncbi:MAG: hypothetical protein NXH81_04005 [Halieaceae bacterium]|jgi:hypothetical protein|uniref:DUF6763 family protein n=1 Tax=Haliea alexandrii TaxID=2448162 RepID=UPI000F0B19CA|nr:DUF6763 family protein [Haliea alexandrii]MCR9184543.1 hypothetical protein [Halieaceae bacterium]